MVTNANVHNMEMMHYLCQREIDQLQSNLDNYLQDSTRMRHLISSCRIDNDSGNNMNECALLAYDSYMSNIEMITDLARKFNLHLQLKKLNKTVTECCQSPQRLFMDYLQWSFYKEQHSNNYDLSLNGFSEFGAPKTSKLPIDSNDVTPSAGPGYTALVPSPQKDTRKVRFSLTPQKEGPKLLYKNLSAFVTGYEFTATISYVEDYDNLVFYICQLHNTSLLELSSMYYLPRLQAPPTAESFCVSIQNDKILRAVVYSDNESTPSAKRILLIDLGEVVTLDDTCVLYQMPIKYQNIPMQAVKCILLGVNVEQNNDRQKLASLLCEIEFERCTFRVVQNINRVLHLLLLQNDEESVEIGKPSKTMNNPPLNPFLSSEEEDDLKNERAHIFDSLEQISALEDMAEPNNCNNQITESDCASSLQQSLAELSTQDSFVDSNVDINSRPLLRDDAHAVVIVTHVSDVEYFYAQIEADADKPLEKLIWTDDEVPVSQRLKQQPILYEMVLAKYNKDDCWYRASVIEIDAKKSLYKVFYVDYGNSEVVTLNSMAQCPHVHCVIPFRAVRCRVADICSIIGNDEMRQQQALDLISLIILNQRFEVEILKRDPKELLVRIIDEEYAEVTPNLIQMGYAKAIQSV